MAPRNHADCVGNYRTAVLSGGIITFSACWHSSGWRRNQNAGWLQGGGDLL